MNRFVISNLDPRRMRHSVLRFGRTCVNRIGFLTLALSGCIVHLPGTQVIGSPSLRPSLRCGQDDGARFVCRAPLADEVD